MKNKQQWRQRSWFKPTMIMVGVVLIITAVELAVHRPFGNFFSALLHKTAVRTFDMEQIVTAADPYLGDQSAPVKIVEFADFNCPYCRAAYPVVREVLSEYQASEVFFQFRDFPVVAASSVWLAMAGSCAHEQNKFWPFHDKLFLRQGQVTESNIGQLAQTAGLNVDSFQRCLDGEKYRNEVADDYLSAENNAVDGTPTFFINGLMFQGVPEKENLIKIIDHFLSTQDSKVKTEK
ncbi:MAG: DsbA family protein [Patescibacteria group bacterium]